MKILFLDTETTGLDYRIHALTQVAGIVEVDGQEVERFDFKIRPTAGKQIDAESVVVQGHTLEEIHSPERLTMTDAFSAFRAVLGRHVDQYDAKDKFYLMGYNVPFDDGFLRQWFVDCGDKWYSSWFWSPAIDIMSIAAAALVHLRPALPNFKLETVAEVVKLAPEGDLHDAMTDIELTRRLLRVVAPGFGKA